MEKIKVEDEFSRSMLITIPKKLKRWLQNMALPTYGTSEHGSLTYSIEGGEGEISCAPPYHLSIFWEEPLDDDSDIYVTDTRLCSVKDNLDFFVEVEQQIYDELQRLSDERE